MDALEQRAWLARAVWAGGVAGAGFAVDETHVVTCAHVVEKCGASGPGDRVRVEFPLIGRDCEAVVLEDGWRPASGSAGDVAVLELVDPPAGIVPVPLRSFESAAGRSFAAYGFPEGYEDGRWSDGRVGMAAGLEWVQLEVGSGLGVEPGFSGAAVWDTEREIVLGLMVTADVPSGGRVAFAVPVGALAQYSRRVREALPTALELDPAFAVWDAAARGASPGEEGWWFTGRRHALGELVGWLRSDGPPAMRVVTGSPGAGKSAVLARLVTSSDRRYRQQMREAGEDESTLAPVGCVDVVFSARDRTVNDLVKRVADVRQLDGVVDVPGLVSTLVARRERLVLVVDGLDEASDPLALGSALGQLAEVGCRVLVGCREHLVGRLGGETMNLDERPWLEDGDVELYARRCLHGRAVGDEAVSGLAREVAGAAQGNFLVARLIVDGIVATGEARRPFPTNVTQAFADRLDALSDLTARELLLALAYTYGDGLPADLWLTTATALSRPDAPYQPGDLRRLLNSPARSFLHVQSDGHVRQYRLFHQALADALQSESDPDLDQQTVWQALTAQLSQTPDGHPRWDDAPAYTREYAAEHAGAAGCLDTVADDAGFLLVGDLGRLQAQLSARPHVTPQTTALLSLARGQAVMLDREHRAQLLALAALHLGLRPLAKRLLSAGSPSWVPRWAHRLGAPNRKLTGHTGAVLAVGFGTAAGRDIVVSGGEDTTVRVWDAATGASIGEPLAGHTSFVYAVAVGHVAGRDIIASYSGDDTVRLWDAATGAPIGEPFSGASRSVSAVAAVAVGGDIVTLAIHERVRAWSLGDYFGSFVGPPPSYLKDVTAVTTGRVAGREVAVLGNWDGTVRALDVRTGELIGEPFTDGRYRDSSDEFAPIYPINTTVTAVAVGHASGRDLIAAARDDRNVLVWDAVTHVLIGEPLIGDTCKVTAVAVGQAAGRGIVVSGDEYGTVRVWDPVTGTLIREPLIGHGNVKAVVVGGTAGRDIIASASSDMTVRVWDATESVPIGEPLIGHDSVVSAVGVGCVGEDDVIVSGSEDGTVRVWDPTTGAPIGEPLTDHIDLPATVAVGRDIIAAPSEDGHVRVWDTATRTTISEPLTGLAWALAVGQAAGRDIIASGSYEGTVRIWDARTGHPVGESLTGHALRVTALAVGHAAERDIIVSGSFDGTVRMWDAGNGRHVGDPLTLRGIPVTAVAVGQASGRRIIAAGGLDGNVRIWDAVTGAPSSQPLTGHIGGVVAVAIGQAAGRDIIASAGTDQTVRVWDPVSRAQVAVIYTLEPVQALALGHSGELYVATGQSVACIAPQDST